MPYHLSENKLSVLDENNQVVPGGTHKTPAEALAHLQALNINVRREEGRPVAPKQKSETHLSQGARDKIPDADFVDPQRRRFFIRNGQDVIDAVHSYGRADPKIPFEHFKQRLTEIAKRKGLEQSLPAEWKQEQKASWLSDPTDEDLYEFLVSEGMEDYLPRFMKQQDYNPGNGIDRASYHPVDERFDFVTAPDWNDDTRLGLPEVWVRAHPFGDSQQKDAHGEYFDKTTDFHEKDSPLPQLPVTYYHNFSPDGTPKDKPTVIGKTIARKYLPDGRWDKIQFFDSIPNEIKARLKNALDRKTFRSSPTVIPDLHHVNNDTGHIDDWATGSIAVLDADGMRQPANLRAIGLPAMKALFKQAQIPFPQNLGGSNMGKTMKAAPNGLKARILKAFMKALGEMDEPETEEEKALAASGQNVVDDTSERARFEGADTENVVKDVQPLPQLSEELDEMNEKPEGANALAEPEVKLDYRPEQKRMKAIIAAQANQLKALQARADDGDFQAWVSTQLVSGKVLPAEVDDLRLDFLQALMDDRASHPVMKAQEGKVISRVERLKANVERRQSHFGEMDLTADQMKALGLQMGSLNFDLTKSEKPFTEQRRLELLNASPMGQKIASDEKKK